MNPPPFQRILLFFLSFFLAKPCWCIRTHPADPHWLPSSLSHVCVLEPRGWGARAGPGAEGGKDKSRPLTPPTFSPIFTYFVTLQHVIFAPALGTQHPARAPFLPRKRIFRITARVSPLFIPPAHPPGPRAFFFFPVAFGFRAGSARLSRPALRTPRSCWSGTGRWSGKTGTPGFDWSVGPCRGFGYVAVLGSRGGEDVDGGERRWGRRGEG